MHCPFCQKPDPRVVDSRLTDDGAQVRRRRQCEACGERFTTFESVEFKLPMIVKTDGRREAFAVKQALEAKGPVTIPREFVLMDRAAIGLGSAFLHLGAEMNWRKLFEQSLEGFSVEGLAQRQAAALGEVGLT